MSANDSQYRIGTINVALSPSAVSSALSSEQTFTVPGLTTDMVVLTVNKPTAQTGLGLGHYRVSADNTLAIQFVNTNSGTAVTPTTAETYRIVVMKPENTDALRGM